ncbi:MAG: DUF4342 domain-containing protein [Clostridiales bacterium]|nr:DUF4342 domain-containing protein [Clostridiales bacterium]
MEITLEKIDSLRERANVSYAEAKEALEKSGGNMIDAIISLEGENKTVYDRAKREQSREKDYVRMQEKKEKYKTNADDFVESSKKLLNSLNETRVIMYNKDRVVFDVSLTITLIAAVFAFPVTVAIFVIGLLTGNKYKIVRKDKKDDLVNSVLDKAAKVSQTVADNLKEKVKDVQATEENPEQTDNTEN